MRLFKYLTLAVLALLLSWWFIGKKANVATPTGNTISVNAVSVRATPTQADTNKSQRRYLNWAFPKIERKNDKVRVLIRTGADIYLLPGYRNFLVGSRFESRGRHHHIKYRVLKIAKEGIVVSYEGSEGGSDVSGEVQLKWQA